MHRILNDKAVTNIDEISHYCHVYEAIFPVYYVIILYNYKFSSSCVDFELNLVMFCRSNRYIETFF